MSSELFDNTVNTYKRYISFSHIGSDLMKLLQYHYEGKEGALVQISALSSEITVLQ